MLYLHILAIREWKMERRKQVEQPQKVKSNTSTYGINVIETNLEAWKNKKERN